MVKKMIYAKYQLLMSNVNNDMEEYVDQIDYLTSQLKEYEESDQQALITENRNLRIQNKRLLTTLMTHLTEVKSRKSSKKKNRLSGTLVNNNDLRRRMRDNSSKRKHHKYKKKSHRKHSSKRRGKKDYRNVPSLSAINKNIMNIQNSNLINNYQSFDSTLNKAMMENFVSSVKNSSLAEDKENHDMYTDGFRMNMHHQSVKTPQGDGKYYSNKRKHRPKTAVRREKHMHNREDLHSSSLQVPYNHMFGYHDEDFDHISPL